MKMFSMMWTIQKITSRKNSSLALHKRNTAKIKVFACSGVLRVMIFSVKGVRNKITWNSLCDVFLSVSATYMKLVSWNHTCLSIRSKVYITNFAFRKSRNPQTCFFVLPPAQIMQILKKSCVKYTYPIWLIFWNMHTSTLITKYHDSSNANV